MFLKKTLKSLLLNNELMLGIYRAIRDEYRFLTSKPLKNKLDFYFNGNIQMENNKFEELETKIFLKLMRHCTLVVNIGANIGYYCCLALSKKKRVIGFEALYQNLRYLLRNIAANKWSNKISIHHLALSDRIGINKIYGQSTGASLIKGWAEQSSFNLTAQNTLDNFMNHVTKKEKLLILIDIEGSEYKMLQGAKKTLRRANKPIWIVEICADEHLPRNIRINPYLLKTFLLFKNNGYASISLEKNAQFIDIAEIKKIQKNKKNTLNTHNFIFVDEKIKNKVMAVLKNA